MNGPTVDWVMHDFGPGTCEHRPGGSRDIRAMIHNNAHYGAAPQAPTLSSPANGATNVATNPTLSWNSVSGVTSYRLQVSKDGFSTYVFDQEITTTSQGLSNLSTGTYSWRVYAIGGNGTSAPSAVWNFTVGLVPPTLSSPANGYASASLTQTLSWQASTGATSYRLQVSTDPAFGGTAVYDNSGTSTSRAIPSGTLSNNKTYYWRVNATGANGTSAWSAVRSFSTVPGVPTLSSPPSQTSPTIPRPPTLIWSAPSGGATSYRVQVSTRQANFTGSYLKFDQSGITSTSKPVTVLNANTTYYWRVNAANAGGGTSAWSSVWTFRTGQ